MQVPGWGWLRVAGLTRPCTHSANPVHGLQMFSINRFSLAHLAERTLLCFSQPDSSLALSKGPVRRILSQRRIQIQRDETYVITVTPTRLCDANKTWHRALCLACRRVRLGIRATVNRPITVKVTSCWQDRVCRELFPGLLTTGYRIRGSRSTGTGHEEKKSQGSMCRGGF